MIWGGRWEGGSGLGTHVHPWLIHANVWQNQYSIVKQNKVKINLKKRERERAREEPGDWRGAEGTREKSGAGGPLHQPLPIACLPACVCTHTLHVHTFCAHTIYTHPCCLLTPAATHPNIACTHTQRSRCLCTSTPHTHKHTQHTPTTHVLRVQPGAPVPGGGPRGDL